MKLVSGKVESRKGFAFVFDMRHVNIFTQVFHMNKGLEDRRFTPEMPNLRPNAYSNFLVIFFLYRI